MMYFTREERRGLTLWTICLLLICLSPYYLPENNGDAVVEKVISEFEDSDSGEEEGSEDKKESSEALAPFDPNEVSAKELIANGLSSDVARRWVKFRSAKGKFSSVDDIYSIYGIDSQWVAGREGDWQWSKQQKKEKSFEKASTAKKPTEPEQKDRRRNQKPTTPVELNSCDAGDLKQLGFDESVAHRIIAYRRKVGPFYRKEDLYKIYHIDSQRVQRLQPALIIDTARLPLLDINTASEEEFQELPGIGPSYASRITSFREALGGFDSPEQMKDVYGLPETTLIEIEPRVTFTSRPIRKLKINECEVEDLVKHPYIDWNLARRLYNYKHQHYPISNLKGMHGIDQEMLDRLAPYLDFSYSTEETTSDNLANQPIDDPQ